MIRMLHIEVKGGEFFNEDVQEFITIKPQKLVMEHSLLSLSKWEAKWEKPFLTKDRKTPEEYLDYIRCMTINNVANPLTYKCLTKKQLESIKTYIQSKQTATTISKYGQSFPKLRNRRITSELIYYWMIANNIPIECEKWHLNRLLMLIKVCNIENNPKKKKMGINAIMQQNREINAARRAKYHTKG